MKLFSLTILSYFSYKIYVVFYLLRSVLSFERNFIIYFEKRVNGFFFVVAIFRS